jgi:hypothetical protein
VYLPANWHERGMKKAIEILDQHIRSYRSMVEMYEANPHNQAVTEYSAKEAAKHVVTLQAAVAALIAAETCECYEAAFILNTGFNFCPTCGRKIK